MAFPTPVSVNSLPSYNDNKWDALVYISDKVGSETSDDVDAALKTHAALDERTGKKALFIASNTMPGNRLISAPTGPLDRDYDDVRSVYDAARNAADICLASGVSSPLLVVELSTAHEAFKNALEVAFLGFCQALWQPLEARQHLGEDNIETIQAVGLYSTNDIDVGWLSALEAGKRVARDLCGTEPERMAPPGFAQYCVDAFAGSTVDVSVIDDDAEILRDYPLLHAVARASVEVDRHQPRVIRLEYTGDGPIEKTLFFAGKGITFDTGGADLKVGGHMAGMSRDKGGAAGVAGFMKVLSEFRPKGIRVVAILGAVRNSIGAEAYIPDEIITSHAGVRVRVGNTDAEGRMVLADILSHLRIEAKEAVAPEVFSVATLTGHAAVAFGPYTALVENGPALAINTAHQIANAGELWGEPAEQSRSRREDYNFVKPRTKADDVLSSNNAPSVSTARGHQFPMAFLSIASGLEEHGNKSDMPLPYTHIDIAGSGVENGDWQHGKPTATPVIALATNYLKAD